MNTLDTEQRAAILADGAALAADLLWTDDEAGRRRRFLEVAYAFHQCRRCGYWTEGASGRCGEVV